MSTDYGTDIWALGDIQDPEVLVSQEQNVAQAIALRWSQDADALPEIGETAPYDCINIRDWLGRRLSEQDRRDLEAQAQQVAAQDVRVLSINVTAAFANNVLSLTGQGFGTQGAFKLVLSVNSLTGAMQLQVG